MGQSQACIASIKKPNREVKISEQTPDQASLSIPKPANFRVLGGIRSLELITNRFPSEVHGVGIVPVVSARSQGY
jgi:hypothetical protein